MENHKAQSFGEIFADFIRGTDFEKTFMEHRAMELWPEVMGPQVASLTGKMEVKNGMLCVHVQSAALRQQLFELRKDVVRRLNEAAGGAVIRDVRFLG